MHYNDNITVTAYPSSGYQLSTLKYNDGSDHTITATNNSGSFYMPAKNVTVSATFTAVSYTVTLNTNSGTIASGHNVTSYTYGTGATLPTDAYITRAGYTFGGWYADAELTDGPVTEISTTATGNKTYWAKWTPSGYALTFNPSPTGGTISVTNSGSSVSSGATFASGTKLDITASPTSGYRFDSWSVTGSGASVDDESVPTTKLTMGSAATTLSATFIQTYTITTAVSGSGTVSGGNTYDSGDPCTLTATPTGNNFFDHWSDGTYTYTDNPHVISSVTSNATYTAYFVAMPFSIANSTDWDNFRKAVNSGKSYSGLSAVTLTNDLSLSGYSGGPVGTDNTHAFQGTFEGNGHTVYNYSSSGVTNNGLFGYVSGSTASIRNVVVSATISGSCTNAGIVVGTLAGGTMYNVAGVGTLSSTGTNKGGLVGSNAGTIKNCYSNVGYSNSAEKMGGLAGTNTGTIANCYAAGVSGNTMKALVGNNTNAVSHCYANATGGGLVGGTASTNSGTYNATAVTNGLKDKDYMYRDQAISWDGGSAPSGYPAAGTYTYPASDTIRWNGLVSALNQWVDANGSTYAKWYRPLTGNINGDLPIMGFTVSDQTSVSTSSSDAKVLYYGGLDALLGSGKSNIFLYGNETEVGEVPTTESVFIHEDAVLTQTTTKPEDFTATAGVTFDNSCGHAHSTQGSTLEYDWHLMSTPFSNAPIGIGYANGTAHGAGSGVDIDEMSNGFFPNNLPMALHDGTWKWDFYAFDEPNHLWINFKRNANNHYDGNGTHIDYSGTDQSGNSTTIFTPGKGYMMAISQPTYMCTKDGTLNKSDISLTLTKTGDSRDTGANLVGNPYHGYLNLDKIYEANSSFTEFYIYDADEDRFLLYEKSASKNTRAASQYVHPHQGFFVIAPSNGISLPLSPRMVGTTNSYFRDDEQVNYPLVNLFAENELGQRDMTTIELHRPELGGALKIDQLRNTDFEIAARMNGERYALLFTPEGTERVPVNFRTETDGTYKLTWDTQNGEFYSLFLIDNKTGITYDMLSHDNYTFEANSRDYASRFYITYDCSGTGIEENNEDNSGYGYGNFAYIENGNIVVDVETQNFASLQIIDMLGRVLYSTTCRDGARTVSTNGLSKGVYVIRLTTNKGTQTQKIVVQ